MAFLTIPSSLTTPLAAVNLMLAGIRRAPVEDLEDATVASDPDVSKALFTLDQTDLDVQGRGWWFNREYGYPITPDAGTGQAVVPDQTFEVTRAYWGGTGSSITVILRGSTLYDRDRRSYDFSDYSSLAVDITMRLEWDMLPQAARRYIALKAAQSFISSADTSRETIQINAIDVSIALANLEAQQDRAMFDTGQQNALQGVSAIGALHGLGGQVRRRI